MKVWKNGSMEVVTRNFTSEQSYWITEREPEGSTGRNHILSFLHSASRPGYIRPLVVLARDVRFSGGSVSLKGDSETILVVCRIGSAAALATDATLVKVNKESYK